MPWNPDIYNKFKKERYTPFHALLQLIEVKQGIKGIDLGCGTGELTSLLAAHIPGSEIKGIDSSSEMLLESGKYAAGNIRFETRSIQEQLATGEKWDLIFSNAALQWIDDHDKLFPEIISQITKGGQLAVQVPSNHDHFTHSALLDMTSREPFKEALQGRKRPLTALTISQYADIFFNHGGKGITVFEKVYPHILNDSESLCDWVSGTAMIPYMERLPEKLRDIFKNEYRNTLKDKYPGSPVFYPFKRILMKAVF